MRKKFSLAALGVFLLALLTSVGEALAQSSNKDFAMPFPKYFIADNDCHHDAWGTWCALDVNSIPNGGPLYSSITGKVLETGPDDNFGNTYLILQNARWTVYMLHDIFDVQNGQNVTIEDRIGTEASIGRSTGAHVHLSVFDRKKNKWVDPRTIVTVKIGKGGEVAVNDIPSKERDNSPNPQPPGEVDWENWELKNYAEIIPTPESPSNLQQEVIEYWQVTYIQSENPFKAYLIGIHWGWFAVLVIGILFLMGDRRSQSWWPFWLVLLVVVVGAFIWSRTPVQAGVQNQQQIPITTTKETEVVFEDPPEPSEPDLEIIFPDPPKLLAEATVQHPVSPSVEIQISYEPRVLKFDSRPPLLDDLDLGTQAWFEWLQEGKLKYETLWYWHDCKSVGVPDGQCGRTKYSIAKPPWEAVLAALTVHQLGGAPIWDNLTQKLQETGNSNGPFATSYAGAMGPLQEKAWFFDNFGAFSNGGGDVQKYLDAMLTHSNWAVTQGVLSHVTDQKTYAHRYAGSPCSPPNENKCKYRGKYNNLMWNNYRGMGDSSYLLARALMESWLKFQQQFNQSK